VSAEKCSSPATRARAPEARPLRDGKVDAEQFDNKEENVKILVSPKEFAS